MATAGRNDLSEFLSTRRARITPEQAGLPVYGAHRRVSGLRREEVALLAGISVEYYTRLERGTVGAVSDGVLDGLVHALQLDEAERDHLFRLVRAASTPTTGRTQRRTPSKGRVRLERILELDYEAFELPGDPGQRINVYTAPPDSSSAEALRLLASWTTDAPATAAGARSKE